MKQSLAIGFVWLVVINLFAVAANNRLNLSGDTAYTWIHQDTGPAQSWSPILPHVQWDSLHYLDIAEHGYTFLGQGQLSNIVFFPLYPALVSLLGHLIHAYSLAGWLISSLFLLISIALLDKLVRTFHPDTDPTLVIIFLLAFPTAFFLNAVYTESLFLALSLGTFLAARQQRWWLAGGLGLLAALTRVTGVLLVLPVAMELWASRPTIKQWLTNTPALALMPAGIVGFFAYHWIRWGDPLLFFKVESWWGRNFHINWSHLELLTRAATVNAILDGTFVLIAVIGTVIVWRKVRPSYGAYMAATIAVALSTGTMMSIGRYILVLFPLFIAAAKIRNPVVRGGLLFACVLFLALYTGLFVNGYWAG